MASAESEYLGVDYVEKCGNNRYVRFKDVLGKGASKTVYKAFDQVEGIEVAWNRIKIDDALQSPEGLEKLYSEVHLVNKLKHPNIIKCYDSWIDHKKKTINMITELFTSGSLRQYRERHKAVDIKAIKNWARQILRGLDYLHSRKPPVIHRDLKCDNVFVNGNQGEVKIGDLGLATIMQHHAAKSVIGTPEFMAPELYDEEYNQLVDIYSFGMCLLEMVTLEYPYSECKNPAQIYRKVSTGVKPASLNKIACHEVREFIEKCLLPSTQRLSAKDLLKDHFFELKLSEVPACDPLRIHSEASTLSTTSNYGTRHMDIDHECNQSNGSSASSVFEFQRLYLDNEFKLRGKKNDDNSILLTLLITNRGGIVIRNTDFLFYLDSDTSLAVATEMVEQLDLTDHDVFFIADFIDFIIMRVLPDWTPCSNPHSSEEEGCQTLRSEPWETSRASSTAKLVAKPHSPHSFHLDHRILLPTTYSNTTCGHSNFASPHAAFVSSPLTNTGNNNVSSGSRSYDGESVRQKDMSNGSSGEVCEEGPRDVSHDEGRTHAIGDRCRVQSCELIDQLTENFELVLCGEGNVAKVWSLDHDQSDLKLELHAIDTQFQQWYQQLSIMKHEAIEATMKRWMTLK